MSQHVIEQLTPLQIVKKLDEFIVGQDAAKRAVAVALRNRYRRSRMPEELQREFVPKNILMMGPTGVGKTEIARRLARLVRAPFVKVEASKFTEVGYVGRDVESIIRDLVEAAVALVKREQIESVGPKADDLAEDMLVEALLGLPKQKKAANPIAAMFGAQPQPAPPPDTEELRERRAQIRADLAAGLLEEAEVTIEVPATDKPMTLMPGSGMEINLGDMLGGGAPKRMVSRTTTVAVARLLLRQAAAEQLVDDDAVNTEAIVRAQEHGIVFIDEIDKIAGGGSGGGHGPDVSREGVQRDILPIVEGTTVTTKYGSVNTDHILFIAAGAFHLARPEDLIPELQGRFPVRVALESLTVDDFVRILTQTRAALLEQYKALLAVDAVELSFADDGVRAIAQAAFDENESTENLGARRLHGMVECLLEDLAFHAGGDHPVVTCNVDAAYVQSRLKGENRDMGKFIL